MSAQSYPGLGWHVEGFTTEEYSSTTVKWFQWCTQHAIKGHFKSDLTNCGTMGGPPLDPDIIYHMSDGMMAVVGGMGRRQDQEGQIWIRKKAISMAAEAPISCSSFNLPSYKVAGADPYKPSQVTKAYPKARE